MKNRIDQLLKGQFEYQKEKLNMVPERLKLKVKPGQMYRGSFRLFSDSGERFRGIIYSSSLRVICEPSEFSAADNSISFLADARQLEEGQTITGAFTVCCELGEYQLPYEIVTEESDKARSEEVTLDRLTETAKADFQSAYRLFLSEGFSQWIDRNRPDLSGMYHAFFLGSVSYESLEEFLLFAEKKEPVRIHVEDSPVWFDSLKEPVRAEFSITREGWGFQKLRITSDAPFVRPEKEEVTTEEFAGSRLLSGYIVDTRLMHPGLNYCRISIESPNMKSEIEVTARLVSETEAGSGMRNPEKHRISLENCYVRFRLGLLPRREWIEQSMQILSAYRQDGGQDVFAELLEIQMLYADQKRQMALNLLQALSEQQERLSQPGQYAFYLYLTTFYNQEEGYVDQVEAGIRELYEKEPENWILLWILLYLNNNYLHSGTARYQAVSEQFDRGCRSRLLYLEAWQALRDDPFLLKSLGEFELHLLKMAADEGALTPGVVRQTAVLALHEEGFRAPVFRLLEACYQADPTDEMVRTVCTYLIKAKCQDKKYFPWFEKGVASSLRITGLYEYYLATTDITEISELPQIIRMYLIYDNSLDYRRKACFFKSVLAGREQSLQTFGTYQQAIQRFVRDQLEQGHFTDELGELYQAFIRRDMLNRPMQEHLVRFLFSIRIREIHSQMHTVVVDSACLKHQVRYPVTDKEAVVAVYDRESRILLEDEFGGMHPVDVRAKTEQIYENERQLKWCMKDRPDLPGLQLYLASEALRSEDPDEASLSCMLQAISNRDYTDSFRDALKKKILAYYLKHPRSGSVRDFLDSIDLPEFAAADKTALITLLAEEGMCEEAFDLLEHFGGEEIPLLQLVRICSRMVLAYEFGENRTLLSLCHTCFASGKYDDKLLRYLLLYYEGPVRDMMMIWSAGVEFELDTLQIEEKILTLVLFTGAQTEGSEPVFESYRKKIGQKKLCLAYADLKAYEFFVKGLPVAKSVFQFIEQDYLKLKAAGHLDYQPDICRLALLQHYAYLPSLSRTQRQVVADLLKTYNARGLRYAFWKRFDKELLAPYQLEGTVFVEYAADPDAEVSVTWDIDGGESRTEPVTTQFEGIFVREFLLFEGEELNCTICEKTDGEEKRSGPLHLRADAITDVQEGRYALLSRLQHAVDADRKAEEQELLETLLMQEKLSGEVFTLI